MRDEGVWRRGCGGGGAAAILNVQVGERSSGYFRDCCFSLFSPCPTRCLASSGGVFILGPRPWSACFHHWSLVPAPRCLFTSLGTLWAPSSTPTILICCPLAALTDNVLLGWMFGLTETTGNLIYLWLAPALLLVISIPC